MAWKVKGGGGEKRHTMSLISFIQAASELQNNSKLGLRNSSKRKIPHAPNLATENRQGTGLEKKKIKDAHEKKPMRAGLLKHAILESREGGQAMGFDGTRGRIDNTKVRGEKEREV